MCRKLALAATCVVAMIAAPAFAADKPAPAQAAPAAKPQKLVKATKADREMAERMAPLSRATFWADQVALDPNDAEAGLKLASALRAMGEWERAGEAAEDVTVRHPESEDAQLDLGRAHIGAGNGFFAIVPLKKAQALNAKDWRPLSLLGVAYEQISREDEAEAAHAEAQRLAPNNPTVVANLAMFRLSQGKPAEAESLLRKAMTLPGAGEQVRQNLAYVIGRQGRLDEAEKLMRQDLAPDAVANNLGYLKAALDKTAAAAPPLAAPAQAAPPRTWDALKNDAG